MLVVQKYGGSSVANTQRIMNVAQRIVDTYKQGHQVVVVLSAQGNLTDKLLEKAMEIDAHANKRELDMLLSTGEQQSAALVAMAVHKLGYSAISLNAVQVGIESTALYGNARIKNIQTRRIADELELGSIVLVTGFQGVNRNADLTTLGRGASDTTAVALAAVLKAELCEIYTDVDGIYTANPRVVPTAKKLDSVSYEDMLELSSSGAQVMHNRAVEMAKRYKVKLVVRSSMTDAPGTLIKEDTGVEKLAVTGLATDRNVAIVSVAGLPDKPGVAFRMFSYLAEAKISVDVILQTVNDGATRDICFTVHKLDLDEAKAVLEAHKDEIGYESLTTDLNVAKLAVVGEGMSTNFGVASAMFEALYECGINILMISTSEIKITVLIDERHVVAASKAVHAKFEKLFFEGE
jgi:aspartate kinase